MSDGRGAWGPSTGPRTRIARREIATLLGEKTVVLALLVQLFIAAFSSFLVVGLVALHDPDATGATGVSFGVTGNGSDALASAIENDSDWEVVRYATTDGVIQAFENDQVDAALVATRTGERYNVTAYAPSSGFRTTLIVAQVKSVLERFEEHLRRQRLERFERRPVPVPQESTSSPYYDFTYTVLLPLLMFLPVFLSGSITSDSLTEEFERGTIELLRAAPIDDVTIVEGKMLAMAVLAPLQAAVWLLLLVVNGTTVARPLALVGLVTAATVVVVALGAVLAVAVRDRRRAQFLYSAGVIAAFGLASLTSASPANLVALLAIGSETGMTAAHLLAYGVAAAAALLLVRRAVGRHSSA